MFKGKDNTAVWFVMPTLALLSLVTIYPVAYVVILSLKQYLPIFGISNFIGLENYRYLLQDDRFRHALGNTAYFTVVSVALELLLGLGLALLLARPVPYRGLLRAFVLLPWAIPTVVSARMWDWIFTTDTGILNYLVGHRVNWLGDPFWAMHAAVLVDVWKSTPFAALLLLAGLQTIPDDVYRAARVDGAGGWQRFRYITLPLLRPVILVVLLFRTLDAFRIFDAVYVLTGGGPANATETVSIYAYRVLFQTLQFGYGSTVSVAVFLCSALISAACIVILMRRRP